MTKEEWLTQNGWTMTANGRGAQMPLTYSKGDYRTSWVNDAITKEKELTGAKYRETDIVSAQPINLPPPVLEDTCLNCGSVGFTSYVKQHLQFDGESERRLVTVSCNKCETVIKADYPRDADGNRVIYPKDGHAFYSYAGNTVFTSARQMAEHLQKHNLIQKGNDRANDPRLKGKRD